MSEMNVDNVSGAQGSEVESVDDVKRHFGSLKAATLSSLFELASNVKSEEAKLDGRVRSQAGDNVVRTLDHAHREVVARDALETAKTEYIRLELEEAEALTALSHHANEVL